MKLAALWTRRTVTAFLILVGLAWLTAKSSQWVFRFRAEALFRDLQTLQVGVSSSADTEVLLRKWRQYGHPLGNCYGELCRTSLSITHILPEPFRGQPDGGIRNVLPILADFLGFRNEGIGIDFVTKNGLVTQKGFGMDVALPVVEWFMWDKSYIPDLAVWSSEVSKFDERNKYNAPHPFRNARQIRGIYGMQVTFLPEETPNERAELIALPLFMPDTVFPLPKPGPNSSRRLAPSARIDAKSLILQHHKLPIIHPADSPCGELPTISAQ